MLKSKRFWGTLLAIGSVVAGQAGVVGDPAVVNSVTAIAAPIYMLITRLIDQAKGKA